MSVLEPYHEYISERDREYFPMYQVKDQRAIIDEAKDKLQRRNRQVVKKRVKDALLTIVAHELVTPVATIVGTVDLLRETQSENVDILTTACTKLLSVTNRLQDLDILTDNGTPSVSIPFDLRNIISSVADTFMQRPQSNAKVMSVHFPTDLPRVVQGNLPRVYGLLMNLSLLAYACSHDQVFQLEVRTEKRSQGQFTAAFTLCVETVKDTYPFFDDNVAQVVDVSQGSLFDPDTLGGRCVGYIIAERCAELLETQIVVYDRKKEEPLKIGFDLILSSDKDEMNIQAQLEKRTGRRPEKIRILVVDDNQLNRKLMSRMIDKLGHDCGTESDGADCVAQINQRPGHYHVIFMDCDMPRMSGYEATKHIREVLCDRDVVIVALTADATAEAKLRCMKAGMNDYFIKPITKELMSIMIDKWFPER